MRRGGRILAARGRGGAMGTIGLLALALLALPALVAAATPQTTLQDVEDEVMCPICGTLLELSGAPQAERQRVLVRRLIARGKSKAEVKEALVANYGPAVLALPEASGFDLSAYLVPAIAFAVAVVALGVALLRWRGSSRRGPPRPAPAAPSGEAAERLEADLDRYDL